MKAVRFSKFGVAAEVAELIDLPDPGPPGEGEVLLDVEASPIQPADLLQFSGRYGATPPPLPVYAGGGAAGCVAAVGAGVTHLRAGDRVMVSLRGGRGNWRERVMAPADKLFALPAADAIQIVVGGVRARASNVERLPFVGRRNACCQRRQGIDAAGGKISTVSPKT